MTPVLITAAKLIGAFVGGALLWTFMEYVLHRFAGHEAKGKLDFSREHLRHHSQDGYFAPTRKKVRHAAPFAVGGLALFTWIGGWVGVAGVVGFFTAYIAYELLHRWLHVAAPRNAYGRWARRHHFAHHFNCPKMNHGVTSPFWDIVFGTHQPTATVRVPHRRAPESMPWLLDNAGDLRPELATDYALVGRRPA